MTERKAEKIALEWYARNMVKAIEGMEILSNEQRGVYNTILDWIYLKADELVDDDLQNAGRCKLHIRVYRRIKGELMALGKLYIEAVDNSVYLTNSAAKEEVQEALQRVIRKSNNGALGARVRWGNRGIKVNENNEGDIAPPLAPPMATPMHNNKEQEQYLPSSSVLPSATAAVVAPQGHSGAVPTPSMWPPGAKGLLQDALGPDFSIHFGAGKVRVDCSKQPATLTFTSAYHAQKAVTAAATALDAAFQAHGGWTTFPKVPSPGAQTAAG